jgi:DNA-binding GntR family transcriptional regulator
VASLTRAEFLEAYQVREALEVMAIRLAVDRIADEAVAGLERLTAEMQEYADRGDVDGFFQANASFHATIVRSARNATLERQWSFLEPYSRTYVTVSQPGLDLLALSERHVPILQALRARDGAAAAEAMHRHLMDAAELLKEPA